MKYRLSIILVFFQLMAGPLAVKAQDSTMDKLRVEAQQRFDNLDYTGALSAYRQLLARFSKEPEYLHKTGVCLIKLNQDQDEAINLMRLATLSGYDPMSWYYLGRACHLNYLFDDAIKAYSRFIIQGKAQDIKILEIERQIEMAKNGIEFTHSGRTVSVQNTKKLSMQQLENASEINGSGKLIRKPAEFCSKKDLRSGYRPLVFLPAYTEINEHIYVAGYQKTSKPGKQIFRVKNINHVNWGLPEPLDNMINTPYDDEYPFFDVKASVLYFSSKGHASMGGYDIFKSVYDWNTKTWSKPENMGFPINSPYDDFVFITDEFSHTASFASNRSTGPGQAMLYRIKLEQDTTGIRFFNVDEIRKASQLLVEVSPQADNNNPVSIQAAETVIKPETIPIPEIQVAISPEIQAVTPKDNYNKVLAGALILQLKADSLSRIVREKRLLARDTPDEELKKQLVADIIQADKDAKRIQREADKKFIEAGNMKKPESPAEDMHDSAVVMAKEIGGTRVYQYNSGTLPDEPGEQVPQPEKQSEPAANEVLTTQAKVQNFAILEQSPYGPSNPITEGLASHSGLVYRIQLGVFSKVRPYDAFGGISPVSFEQVSGSSMLKYYAGLFYSLNTVMIALETVRSKGYPDAFIVAFLDGKPITTEKAREVEFEGFRL